MSDLNNLQTPREYAATAVLFVFAIACFYALTLAERRASALDRRNRDGDTTLRKRTRRPCSRVSALHFARPHCLRHRGKRDDRAGAAQSASR